jgi:hypothetical protein
MSMVKRILFLFLFAGIFCMALAAEDSNYIRLNRESKWEITSNRRLEQVINNPAKYTPEEFIASLHEYSKRWGFFARPSGLVQALCNAYIAHNPEYESFSTEEIFIQTARARGVPSLQNDPYNDALYDDAADVIETILSQYAAETVSLGITAEGQNEDGSIYVVYQVNQNIERTITTDSGGEKYISEKFTSLPALNEAVERYTQYFTEPVRCLRGGYEAFVNTDAAGSIIDKSITSYRAVITLIGSRMFVEEFRPESKIVIQRQWCTLDFFEEQTEELGDGWGFIASWDSVEDNGE